MHNTDSYAYMRANRPELFEKICRIADLAVYPDPEYGMSRHDLAARVESGFMSLIAQLLQDKEI